MKTSLLLGVLLSSLSMSSAQPYSIPRFTIAAGGGPLTGGPYTIQGTVGQPEPGGPRFATPYVVTGGFWPGATAASTSVAWELTAELQRDGLVLISWPLSAAGLRLEEAFALGAAPGVAPWTAVPLPYQTNADRVSVTAQPVGSRFYRLKRP